MKASQENSKRSEKHASFGVVENSIDKLTSLVNKLDMKLDKWEAQYRPAVYQNRNREHRQRQVNSYRSRNRSFSVM